MQMTGWHLIFHRITFSYTSKHKAIQLLQFGVIKHLMDLREQLKNVCQLGAHGSEPFSQSQARTVLGMTKVLLAEPTVGFSAGIEDLRKEL